MTGCRKARHITQYQGAEPVAERCIGARGHGAPGLASGYCVQPGQGTTCHSQRVSEQCLRRERDVEPGDDEDSHEGNDKAGKRLCGNLSAAENIEESNPPRLKADQSGCDSHGSQLQGSDEAGEVQCQGDRCQGSPAQLSAVEAEELLPSAHSCRNSHDERSECVAPERDGEGRCRSGGHNGSGRGDAQHADNGEEKGH